MLSDNELQKKFIILQNKFKSGYFEDVINGAKVLLKKRKHQVLYNIICLSYQNIGEFEKAIEIMEQALTINSRNVYFLNNLGVSYYKLEDYSKANYYFIRGLSIEPEYVTILNNLGNLSRDLNNTKEAIKYYKKCLQINDKLEQPLFNLALCYESIGDFDEAKRILNEILKLKPEFTECDRIISTMTKYDENHPHIKKIIDKMDNLSLNNHQKMHLYFALGKYYEDTKDYEESFRFYSQGNKTYKMLSGYQIKKDKEYFSKIKEFNFKQLENEEILDKERQIIFILGMPRSGTSLVEQILSSHNNVFGGGELNFLSKIVENNFLKEQDFKKLDTSEIIQILKNCKHEYFSQVNLLDETTKVFTDKAPLNFRYIGFIKKIFPNAKIVNCIRDPIDICWSNFKNFFSAGLYFSNNLEDIGNFYKLYKDLMNYWDNLFPNFIYNIEYQRLIDDPKNEIEKLLAHCNLEWDDNCLNHHENTRSIKTVSSTQARKPIYKVKTKAVEPYMEYLLPLNKIINN